MKKKLYAFLASALLIGLPGQLMPADSNEDLIKQPRTYSNDYLKKQRDPRQNFLTAGACTVIYGQNNKTIQEALEMYTKKINDEGKKRGPFLPSVERWQVEFYLGNTFVAIPHDTRPTNSRFNTLIRNLATQDPTNRLEVQIWSDLICQRKTRDNCWQKDENRKWVQIAHAEDENAVESEGKISLLFLDTLTKGHHYRQPLEDSRYLFFSNQLPETLDRSQLIEFWQQQGISTNGYPGANIWQSAQGKPISREEFLNQYQRVSPLAHVLADTISNLVTLKISLDTDPNYTIEELNTALTAAYVMQKELKIIETLHTKYCSYGLSEDPELKFNKAALSTAHEEYDKDLKKWLFIKNKVLNTAKAQMDPLRHEELARRRSMHPRAVNLRCSDKSQAPELNKTSIQWFDLKERRETTPNLVSAYEQRIEREIEKQKPQLQTYLDKLGYAHPFEKKQILETENITSV